MGFVEPLEEHNSEGLICCPREIGGFLISPGKVLASLEGFVLHSEC